MNLLSKKYKIETARSKADVMRILRENTEPEEQVPLMIQMKFLKPFYGEVNSENFRIAHDTLYLNPFVPAAEGKVSEIADTTLIELRMKMGQAAKASLGMMLTISTALSVVTVFLAVINAVTEIILKGLISMTICVLFTCFISYLCFLYQSLKSKDKLEKLLF